MDDIRDRFARAGLYRDDQRLVAGVCAGLGRRLGLRPGTARVLFVLLLMVLPGSQVLVYPVLWVLMPVQTRAAGGGYPCSGG
jgi:phage shock protein C